MQLETMVSAAARYSPGENRIFSHFDDARIPPDQILRLKQHMRKALGLVFDHLA